MGSRKLCLWYGTPPKPGAEHMLRQRGYAIERNSLHLEDPVLRASSCAVFSHCDISITAVFDGLDSVQVQLMLDYGLRVIIICAGEDIQAIIDARLKSEIAEYPWRERIVFVPDLQGVRLDEITMFEPDPPDIWAGIAPEMMGPHEPLNREQSILINRSFPKAQELYLRPLKGGFTGSQVFMAYEKRGSSISHWTQPRLVKIGQRKELGSEAKAMREVSPFVPFELRPNLSSHIEGYRSAVIVADFVDKSESLIDAARAGRAEAAISNLFNRTLRKWRDHGTDGHDGVDSLAAASTRLRMFEIANIQPEYLESLDIESAHIDFDGLWAKLLSIRFAHRAATIHGDLHGDNVRVRGDDAILIDLGAVKGTDSPGGGAPLCFDVAMLDVALVFTCTEKDELSGFKQDDWEAEIAPYFQMAALTNAPKIETSLILDSWLHGCLQRLRSFGTYEQSDPLEYPIAVAIALWRWAKFPSRSAADKRRRIVALQTGARLISDIVSCSEKKREKSESNSG